MCIKHGERNYERSYEKRKYLVEQGYVHNGSEGEYVWMKMCECKKGYVYIDTSAQYSYYKMIPEFENTKDARIEVNNEAFWVEMNFKKKCKELN